MIELQFFSKIRTILIFSILFVGSFLFSQSKDVPNNTSELNFKVNISLSSLEKTLNQSLPQTLVNDASFTNNNNDNLKAKVSQNGKLKLSAYFSNKMLVEIPLKVIAEKRYQALGLSTSKKVKFSMKMYLVIAGSIDSKGNFISRTKVLKYEFTEKPTLDIAGLSFNITAIIKDILDENKNEYAKQIDQQIKSQFPLKENLTSIVQYFSEPMKLSDEYKTWLDFFAHKIYYTPLLVLPKYLQTTLRIDSDIKTYISDTAYAKQKIVNLPKVGFLKENINSSVLETQMQIPYYEATKMAQNKFNQTLHTFKNGKYTIKVQNIEIGAENNQIVLQLETTGSFNGTILISGKPFYNSVTQQISLQNSDVKVKTKNILHKMALWVKERDIKKKMEFEYGIPIAEIIKEVEQNLNNSLNTNYLNAVLLKGETKNITIKSIQASQNSLFIDTQLEFILEVKINKLVSF